MDDNVPRGILFVLDTDLEPKINDLQFEKMVCDLYSEGRCILAPTKWMH
jgi:hypothetical protein